MFVSMYGKCVLIFSMALHHFPRLFPGFWRSVHLACEQIWYYLRIYRPFKERTLSFSWTFVAFCAFEAYCVTDKPF